MLTISLQRLSSMKVLQVKNDMIENFEYDEED